MEKDSEKLFRELKEELTGYIKLRSDLVKINLYEKTSKAMSVLLINLLIIISGYFTLLFISILIGIVLSHLLHSWLLGFSIVTVVYIVLFFTLAVFRRKQIELYFTNTVAKILFNEFEE